MYVAIISFFIWGFFNFFLTQFKSEINIVTVIFYLYCIALIIMLSYKKISKTDFSLTLKEKFINALAGSFQALVYVSYFYLLFIFPNDSLVIVLFYNLFGLILVFMDNIFYKTKNNLIEIIILLSICLLSITLIFKTQLLLGKSYDTVSFNALWGLLPAIIAASIGILYKYSTFSYKCTSLQRVYALNLNLLFYRSLGGFILMSFIFLSTQMTSTYSYEFNQTELFLGLLYAIFPFLLGHFFYSLSIYKKASIIILSVLIGVVT